MKCFQCGSVWVHLIWDPVFFYIKISVSFFRYGTFLAIISSNTFPIFSFSFFSFWNPFMFKHGLCYPINLICLDDFPYSVFKIASLFCEFSLLFIHCFQIGFISAIELCNFYWWPVFPSITLFKFLQNFYYLLFENKVQQISEVSFIICSFWAFILFLLLKVVPWLFCFALSV